MKKIILSLSVIFISLSQSSLLATNPISVAAFNEMHFSIDEAGSLITRSKAKTWIVKKWLKIGKKISIKKLSNFALILGALSLILLFVLFFSGFYIAVSLILALAGTILSIIVLRKSKKDKPAFKKTRRKAWFGLVLSLITFLIPLVLYAIAFAILSLFI